MSTDLMKAAKAGPGGPAITERALTVTPPAGQTLSMSPAVAPIETIRRTAMVTAANGDPWAAMNLLRQALENGSPEDKEVLEKAVTALQDEISSFNCG